MLLLAISLHIAFVPLFFITGRGLSLISLLYRGGTSCTSRFRILNGDKHCRQCIVRLNIRENLVHGISSSNIMKHKDDDEAAKARECLILPVLRAAGVFFLQIYDHIKFECCTNIDILFKRESSTCLNDIF